MLRPLTLALSVALAAFAATAPAQTAAPRDEPYAPGALQLNVDASDVTRRIVHASMSVPVLPGPLTLLYPQWIPGSHSASGPLRQLAGLKITGNGQRIEWLRDPLDVYAFRLTVPDGVSRIELSYDVVTPTAGDQGRVVMTPEMLSLQWSQVALYPAGHYASQVRIEPTLKIPAGWHAASALAVQTRNGDTVQYQPVAFDVLLDTPVLAGKHHKQLDLDPGAKTPVLLDIVADHPRYLEIKPEQITTHQRLVQQAYKLYGARHYDHYNFLLSLSDNLGGIGLEHQRSSENGVDPAYFTEWKSSAPDRDLLPHEFTHSWNGKFRRPADLATPNFNVPMSGTLLWVYEGQTQFWGHVLAARSGLWSAEQARDALAMVASTYTIDRPGFAWRNVQDTTNDPVIAGRRPQPSRSWQMSEDYYSAGQLTWLAVDAKLRELSGGKRSLDDFARGFFGVDDGAWRQPHTYRFEDVIATLDGVAQYDWASFLRGHIDAHAPPLDGLRASGWELVYTDTPSDYQKQVLAQRKSTDFTASLGLGLSKDGTRVSAVRWDGPAFDAGIALGASVLAVNGQSYTAERLEDAIRGNRDGTQPIELIMRHGDVVRPVRIDYRDGLKYPHLQRISGSKDRLSQLLAPK